MLIALLAQVANADTFAAAHYDPLKDRLIVTMIYRGSNPNHEFSLQWGQCEPLSGGSAPRQIIAVVLDSQWNDMEQRDYRKTARFRLEGISCRPAVLTLQTAPHFRYTLQIPAAPARSP